MHSSALQWSAPGPQVCQAVTEQVCEGSYEAREECHTVEEEVCSVEYTSATVQTCKEVPRTHCTVLDVQQECRNVTDEHCEFK